MNIVSKSNYRVSQGAKQFIVVVGVVEAHCLLADRLLAERKLSWENLYDDSMTNA